MAAEGARSRSIATVLIVAVIIVLLAIVLTITGIGAKSGSGVSSGSGSDSGSTGQATTCQQLADPTIPGATDVAGYSGEQLVNAATIVNTAKEMGLDEHAQLLGVMAAMGESSLRNLPYGDWQTSGAVNPDGTPTSSLGLFQQQEWWGTQDQRLDPASSARLFYQRLVTIDGWEWRPATAVIHDVQVNTDPDHYAPYESPAYQVISAIRACS